METSVRAMASAVEFRDAEQGPFLSPTPCEMQLKRAPFGFAHRGRKHAESSSLRRPIGVYSRHAHKIRLPLAASAGTVWIRFIRSPAADSLPGRQTWRKLHVQLLSSPGAEYDAVGACLVARWSLDRRCSVWVNLE